MYTTETHASKTRQLKRSKRVPSDSVLKLSVAVAYGNRQHKNVSHLNDVVQFCLSIEGCDTSRLEFSPLCHPFARLVVRDPRLSKWLHKDGNSAQHGLCFESSNVYSLSQLPGVALPSADSADGRQSRQPITCVSAVAGGGVTSKKWTKLTVY